MTSRHYLIDLIELIANDIALLSHYQELMNSYDDENLDEYNRLFEKSQKVLERRRHSMRILENVIEKQPNNKYRCIVKHSIASYQFASECMYADMTNIELKKIQQSAYEDMIENLCLYL